MAPLSRVAETSGKGPPVLLVRGRSGGVFVMARDELLERVERLGEGQVIELPDERDHVAVRGAAEAVEAPRLGVDGERRSVVLVEGAAAEEDAPRAPELDALPDHVRDRDLALDALDPFPGRVVR